MGIESFEQPDKEKEQTQEEIESVLKQALEKGLHVNLVITDLSGAPVFTPDLIVEEFEGDDLRMTYLAEDDDVGESIPLDLKRIKKAELINKQ
ncbi:MAG: hypothetical protein NTZ49_05640 [Candidatus Parcubacteria bacterium]|nr:hypothetical protein [Candidatus Parcubacteria bacterium]